MTPRRALRLLWPPVLIALVLLVGWQLLSDHGIRDPQVLPSPSAVVSAGWHERATIWHNAVPTLRETELGFALSFALSWILASAMDFTPPVRRALYPLLVASQTIPIVAIAPLFVVLLVALATFFPLTVSLAAGFATADGDADRLLRSMGASRWRIFWTVRVPGALPFFFSGLRVAITYAIGGAVFAEYQGAESGLGIYLQQMQQVFRTDLVFATVVVIALLSVVLFALTYLLQAWLTPWRKYERAQEARR
jgi:ABC-type nitrate/sulfonate/bicarbonate transport system permease component